VKVGENFLHRLAGRRRRGRKLCGYIARSHIGKNRPTFRRLEIIRDPIDDVVTVTAELLRGHAAALVHALI